jgi:hypothetical protein
LNNPKQLAPRPTYVRGGHVSSTAKLCTLSQADRSKEAGMEAKLTYAIKFVADMDRAVRFHRDTLGLALKFQSPEWSEFATGPVTLALHLANEKNPAGGVELGFAAKGLKGIYEQRQKNGIRFTAEPKPLHGILLANFLDSEGAECSLSDDQAS